MAKFDTTIQAALTDGLKELPAVSCGPIFAAHRETYDQEPPHISGWTLSHRASGYSVKRGLRLLSTARKLAKRITPLADWNFTDPSTVKSWQPEVVKIILREREEAHAKDWGHPVRISALEVAQGASPVSFALRVPVGGGAVMAASNPSVDGGLEWQLRYGSPEAVRFVAAEVLASYDYLCSQNINTGEAIRRLRLLRKASAHRIDRLTAAGGGCSS
jgi:hypothetical protein